MKFKLPTHQPSGQARELVLTNVSLSVTAQENLLDKDGKVIFPGSSKQFSYDPYGNGINPVDPVKKAAQEELCSKVLEAMNVYYQKINP